MGWIEYGIDDNKDKDSKDLPGLSNNFQDAIH